MNMKAQIQTELNRLAAQSGGGTQLLGLDTGAGRLDAELLAIDQLACSFNRFAYQADSLANASMDELKAIASALSNQLSYLLESISPIEIDSDACVVQMRSNPPTQDDDGTKYYELVVCRSEISLCRFAKTPGQPRQVVPASVTREVFERLAEDFVAAAP